MEPYGALWSLMERYGALWSPMDVVDHSFIALTNHQKDSEGRQEGQKNVFKRLWKKGICTSNLVPVSVVF